MTPRIPIAPSILTLFALSLNLSAQSPLEKAVDLAKKKNYTAANQLLAGVAEPDPLPQRIAFHRLKAAVASGLGEAKLAANEMRVALSLAPTDAALLIATSISEMQAGLLDEALIHAQSAGDMPAAKAVLGDIEDKRRNYEAAAKAYQAAVLLAPGEEPYRLALALELIQHQSFPNAISFLIRSLQVFPNSAKLETLLGIANYASGFRDEATHAFEAAIAADPHFDSAYQCLARVLLESSAPPGEGAIALLCRWNAIACSAVRLRVAREQSNSGLIHQSIAVLEQAPASALASCELAKAYQWSQQLTEAREPMEACVRLDPTPQNHYRLGLLYQKLGLPVLAHQEMEARNRMQASMSEETAVGMNALQSFKLAVK